MLYQAFRKLQRVFFDGFTVYGYAAAASTASMASTPISVSAKKYTLRTLQTMHKDLLLYRISS